MISWRPSCSLHASCEETACRGQKPTLPSASSTTGAAVHLDHIALPRAIISSPRLASPHPSPRLSPFHDISHPRSCPPHLHSSTFLISPSPSQCHLNGIDITLSPHQERGQQQLAAGSAATGPSSSQLLLLQQGEAVGEGLFPSAARFNHACAPNVGLSFDSWGCLVASAARDAVQGEELFISYVGVVAEGDSAAAAAAAEDGPAEATAAAAPSTAGLFRGTMLEPRRKMRAQQQQQSLALVGSSSALSRGARGGVELVRAAHQAVAASTGKRVHSSSARAERRGRLLHTYLFECDCDLCARGL